MNSRMILSAILVLFFISTIGCSIPMRKYTNLPNTTPAPEEFDTTFICVIIGVTAFMTIGPGSRVLGMDEH